MIKFVSRLSLSGARINREAGVIKGVSLIALGDARGHNKSVDQKTLESVRDCARQYADGLRVKFNPNTFNHGDGTLAGYIPASTIQVTGNKTVGDLHLYNSLNRDMREYLFELAETTPANIGLSIEFSGDDEDIGGQRFARCSEIFAATIVDLPAANPTGLFATKETPTPEQDTFMTNEQVTQLTTSVTEAVKEGIKQAFAQPGFPFPPPPKKEEPEPPAPPKDQTQTTPVVPTPGEGEEDQQPDKKKPVAEMSAAELTALISRANMQFFKQTGGKPAKPTVERETNTGGDPFENRVAQHMQAGARGRGIAIMRARRDAPQEYNAWRAKQNPQVNKLNQ